MRGSEINDKKHGKHEKNMRGRHFHIDKKLLGGVQYNQYTTPPGERKGWIA